MTLPNIFAATPAGNVPASELDANFTFLEAQGIQSVVATGTANSYTITPADAWTTSYANYINRALIVSFPVTNTGSSTGNVSGIGSVSIKKNVLGVATNIGAGDITAHIPYILINDGTQLWLYGLPGSSSSSGSSAYIDVHAQYNAIPDARMVIDVVTTASSTTITSATANFTSADVGKSIKIYNFSTGAYIFRGSIASVTNATTAVISSPANSSATAGNALAYFGTDNATAINAALTAAYALLSQQNGGVNTPMGAGTITVLFPTVANIGDGYLFNSQLTTYPNVTLNTQAMLYNNLGGDVNDRTFAITCSSGIQWDRILMECGGGLGVKNGTSNVQSSTFGGQCQLWNVGTNYDATKTPPSQTAMSISGNDYTISGFWCKGGNVGIDYIQASDIRMSLPEIIGCATGIRFAGCENAQITNATFDTCSYTGIMIDGCHNITANGNMFSVNSTGLTYGVACGLNDSTNINRVIDMSFNMQRSGGIGWHIAYTQDSWFKHIMSNSANYSGGGVPLTNIVEYGTGNTGMLYVQGIGDSSIATRSSGSITGIFQDFNITNGSAATRGATVISGNLIKDGLVTQ